MAERKLTPKQERIFEVNVDTNKIRYIHDIGDDNLYNVKRQVDEVLLNKIDIDENVRLSPKKIIFTEAAYNVWREFLLMKPARKSRTAPELRIFSQLDDDIFFLKLRDEIARVVAGTLTSNAKEIHKVLDVNITYDKEKNEVYIDIDSLAKYLKAIKQNKPSLLENNPDFKKYINETLNAIDDNNSIKENTNFSNVHGMPSLFFRAQDSKVALQNKTKPQQSLSQSEQRLEKTLKPKIASVRIRCQ